MAPQGRIVALAALPIGNRKTVDCLDYRRPFVPINFEIFHMNEKNIVQTRFADRGKVLARRGARPKRPAKATLRVSAGGPGPRAERAGAPH